MPEKPKSSASQAGPTARWVAWSVVLLIAAGVFLGWRFWPRAKPLVVPREDLVLKDQKLHRKGEEKPFTGVMIESYPGAKIKSRSEVLGGLLDGLSEGWNEEGRTEVRERFRNGVSQGLREKWYPSGAKMSEVMIEDGLLTGRFIRWHENGQIAEEISMAKGKPDGPSTAYYPDGSIKAKAVLKEGEVIERKFWQPGEFFASADPNVTTN